MKFNENNVYKSPSTFLNDLDKYIPKSLKLLLDILIKTHKHTPKNNSWVQWDNKIITIAHIIMSCVRPRSFSSSILLALSSMIHKKFAAKGLIECLYNIGLCASYSETVRFETSIVSDPENLTLLPDSYLQFVFDNADHNTATIDGKNTFHCIGGIMCVTPVSSVKTDSEVTRLKGTLPEITSGKFGYLPLVELSQTEPFSLKKLIVQDLDNY